MFNFRRRGTTIAEGLKIVGHVTADGLVDVRGEIDGEIQCTTLIVSRKGIVKGTITAERVRVDGRVEGPITGRDIVFKPGAYVIGDICHETLIVESGAHFDGSSRKRNSGSPEAAESATAGGGGQNTPGIGQEGREAEGIAGRGVPSTG